jgi:methylase of polypeptide subunit release factors
LVDKSVLELGSGTGFLGLIIADIQVNYGGVTGLPILYLTDVNEDVLRQCSENTRLSCSKRRACAVGVQLKLFQTRLTATKVYLLNP